VVLCDDLYRVQDGGGYELLADVEASYREGVVEGYLRPIEGEAVDGRAFRDLLNGSAPVELVLSSMTSGFSDVLTARGYWQAMVDKALAKLRSVRAIDDRGTEPDSTRNYAGLIGACNQKHAQEIVRYIERRHPDLPVLLAVSDDDRAQDNLTAFKRRKHAVLVTVGMAYVGYDHQWITVVLCLGAFRHPGWLDQFAFRGGRVLKERPLAEQVLWIYGPDDELFVKWLDERRSYANEAVRLRDSVREVDTTTREPKVVSVILQGETLASRIMGMNPDDDIHDPELKEALEAEQRAQGLGALSLTKIHGWLKAHGIDPKASRPTPKTPNALGASPFVTDSEYAAILRTKLSDAAKSIVGIMKDRGAPVDWDWAYAQINNELGCRVGDPACDTRTLAEALKFAETVLKPRAMQWAQRSA